MIVNDVDVVNHDIAIVFVTEKNSVTADPRRFYIALPQENFIYYLELTDLKWLQEVCTFNASPLKDNIEVSGLQIWMDVKQNDLYLKAENCFYSQRWTIFL